MNKTEIITITIIALILTITIVFVFAVFKPKNNLVENLPKEETVEIDEVVNEEGAELEIELKTDNEIQEILDERKDDLKETESVQSLSDEEIEEVVLVEKGTTKEVTPSMSDEEISGLINKRK
jgi:uncharacterized membrane protein YhiD involved in acid resistance